MARIQLAALLALCLPAAAFADGSASIFVDAAADPAIGDGSREAPFATISAAVASAQAAPVSDDGVVTVIHVAEGTYANESWPIQLSRGLRLVGETELVRDSRGLPTGARRMSRVDGGARQMFLIADDDVAIERLYLRAGSGRELIHVDGSASGRGIEGLSIRENVLEGGLIRTRWASGTIDGNLMRKSPSVYGLIRGGPADHPARIRFLRNRVTGAFLNGIHFDGDMGSPTTGPSASEFDIEGNEFSNNGSAGQGINSLPQFGAGAQFFIDDADNSNLPSEQHIDAQIVAVVVNNTFEGNQNYGVVMGGRIRSPKSSARVKFFAQFSGNGFCGNGNNAGIFGFTFFSRSLKFGTPGYVGGAARFFGNSEYQVSIDDGDGLAQAFDHDNSSTDPGNGAVLENRLEVNDSEENLAGTSISPFKKAVSCTPPSGDDAGADPEPASDDQDEVQ